MAMTVTIESSENLSLLEQAKLMIEHKQIYRMDQLFRNSKVTLDDIEKICNYIDTDLKTREERKFFINGLQQVIRAQDAETRAQSIRVLAPHLAIVATMLDGYTFYGKDIQLLWELGTGRKLIKRSQRKLRSYLFMLSQFSEWVEAQDLEFGVFMAAKMPRANVTNIMANEYSKKLNTSQQERVEALKLLFHMNAQDDMYY